MIISRTGVSATTWIVVTLFWFPLNAIAQVNEAMATGPDHHGTERVVWQKAPIKIPLVVGEERLVHFPESVSVGLPPALSNILRSQSINGTLYLLAREPFEQTRVMVRSEEGGPLYVLDLSGEPKEADAMPLPEVDIILPSQRTHKSADTPETQSERTPQPWGYVALTRFAAQQLYAPSRLLPRHSAVVPVPVDAERVELVRGGSVEAVPISAWKAGGLYVTAVQLINQSESPVVLDPRELRGHWLTATFQHNRLLPSGRDADTTVVYLVSDRPFDVAR
jgi:integrating conjugative element protein (TIGR03749 family)